MANSLIPQELDQLIQEYLTDGVLTDKERAVILRKAEGLGLDRDEIDLYLDAQVQKIDQATDAATRRQKGKSCPYCGGSIPLLTDKCPHCGENVTPEASTELQEIFDNLEEALVDMKSGVNISRSKATVERYARKAKMYYGNNPKVKKLLEEIEEDSVQSEKVARSNARKEGVMNYAKNHKFLSGCLLYFVGSFVFLCIISLGISAYSYFKDMNSEDFAQQVNEYVTKDELNKAKELLINDNTEIEYGNKEFYDNLYLNVIQEYIQKNDFNSAEKLGLSLKAKGKYYWDDTSTHTYLIETFKQAGRNYSTLASDKDKEEMQNINNDQLE